jgi:4-amino-4-deoxy-L-arabinose transferase-like glycosyltransferase
MQITSTPAKKSIFQSTTFWGAVLTAIAAVSPAIAKNVENYQNTGKIDPNGISQIVVVLATSGVTILGRINATDTVYTPKGFPGADKPRE